MGLLINFNCEHELYGRVAIDTQLTFASSLITDQCCLNIFLGSDFEFTLEHVSTIINYFIVCLDNKRLQLDTLGRDIVTPF